MEIIEGLYFTEKEAISVKDQPRVIMTEWRLLEFRPSEQQFLEAPDDATRAKMEELVGDIFLMGWLLGKSSLRITTPVKKINIEGREMITSSGRIYEIQTPPAVDEERLMIIASHANLSGMPLAFLRDISNDVWAVMQKCRH